MEGHEGRIKQDALLRGGRSSPLHNLNQDRCASLLMQCSVLWASSVAGCLALSAALVCMSRKDSSIACACWRG